MPRRSSSDAIARVTAGGDMPSLRAPAAKLSCSATATKTLIRWKRSIVLFHLTEELIVGSGYSSFNWNSARWLQQRRTRHSESDPGRYSRHDADGDRFPRGRDAKGTLK